MNLADIAKGAATVTKAAKEAKGEVNEQKKQATVANAVKDVTGRDVRGQIAQHRMDNYINPPKPGSSAAPMPGADAKRDEDQQTVQEEPVQPEGYESEQSGVKNAMSNMGQLLELPPEAAAWTPEDRARVRSHNIARARREEANENELNHRYLENHPEYMARYESYVNSLGEGETPESYRTKGEEWDNEIQRKPEEYDQEAYISWVMDNTDEGRQWKKDHLGSEDETFDYYRDYPTLATDNSQSSEDVWTLLYTDPNAYGEYYDMLGTNLDADDNGEVTPQEAHDFYQRMREYNPEALDPYGDAEEMGWIYGRQNGSMAAANHTVDAYSNWQTDQVRNALLDGTYSDLVASGELNALVDSNGTPLVELLSLDNKADHLVQLMGENRDMNDPELIAAQEDFEAGLAQYNNMAKEAAMADYYASNEDYNGYLLDFNNKDYSTANMVGDMMTRNPLIATAVGDNKQAIYDDAIVKADAAAYAQGLNQTFNNTAGGRSDFAVATPGSRDAGYYSTLMEEAPEGDIMSYTGSTDATDQQNLQYLLMNRAGLADQGYGLYTGYTPPSREELLAAQKQRDRDQAMAEAPEYIRNQMQLAEANGAYKPFAGYSNLPQGEANGLYRFGRAVGRIFPKGGSGNVRNRWDTDVTGAKPEAKSAEERALDEFGNTYL